MFPKTDIISIVIYSMVSTLSELENIFDVLSRPESKYNDLGNII